MRIRTTAVWLWMICAELSTISLMGHSAAQTPAVVPAQAAPATDTGMPAAVPVAPTAPSVTEDSRPEQLAVCNKLQTSLEDAAVEEMRKLMIYVVANDIFFSGAPYVLFELGADGKPTGTWMPCVQVRHLDGFPTSRPKAPYFETTIPALRGIAATCPKEPPAPVNCKAAIANYLSAKGLIAIGAPRITDQGSGADTTSTIWVPYGVKTYAGNP